MSSKCDKCYFFDQYELCEYDEESDNYFTVEDDDEYFDSIIECEREDFRKEFELYISDYE